MLTALRSAALPRSASRRAESHAAAGFSCCAPSHHTDSSCAFIATPLWASQRSSMHGAGMRQPLDAPRCSPTQPSPCWVPSRALALPALDAHGITSSVEAHRVHFGTHKLRPMRKRAARACPACARQNARRSGRAGARAARSDQPWAACASFPNAKQSKAEWCVRYIQRPAAPVGRRPWAGAVR